MDIETWTWRHGHGHGDKDMETWNLINLMENGTPGDLPLSFYSFAHCAMEGLSFIHLLTK